MKDAGPLQAAKADLARIDAEIERLQGDRKRVSGFIEMYQSYSSGASNMLFLAYANPQSQVPKKVPPGALEQKKPRSSMTKREIVADAIEGYLRVAGSADLSVLYDFLLEQGIEIGTGQPKSYLSSMIHKSKRFQLVKGRKWVIKPKGAPNGQTVDAPS